MRIEVITQLRGAPDALLRQVHPTVVGLVVECCFQCPDAFGDFASFGAARQLLPQGSVFDAELTARWGSLVACSDEFSTWWRTRHGRPRGFFLNLSFP